MLITTTFISHFTFILKHLCSVLNVKSILISFAKCAWDPFYLNNVNKQVLSSCFPSISEKFIEKNTLIYQCS